MNIAPFALERHFARHEFSARYLLSASDCEALSLGELLRMADPETQRMWDGLTLGYTETPGHPLLRELIASLYQDAGPDDVLVSAPEEGIFLLMHALLKPGDHVICTSPAYQSLYEIARSIGCEVTGWESDEDRRWRFDPGFLKQELRPSTRLVVINFPHNPTGYVPEKKDLEAIIDIVSRGGVHLFSDEMYRPLEIEPGTMLPAACDLYERAHSLFGLSKAFGLPGLRLGWIVSRDRDVLSRLSALKDYTTICASAPSEILGIVALENQQRIIGQHLTRIRKNLAVLDSFFSEFTNLFSWTRPRGGSVCFPRLLFTHDSERFCRDMLKDTGIMLVSSRLFDYGGCHVRLGFGRENLPEVLGLFSEYLSKQNGCY